VIEIVNDFSQWKTEHLARRREETRISGDGGEYKTAHFRRHGDGYIVERTIQLQRGSGNDHCPCALIITVRHTIPYISKIVPTIFKHISKPQESNWVQTSLIKEASTSQKTLQNELSKGRIWPNLIEERNIRKNRSYFNSAQIWRIKNPSAK